MTGRARPTEAFLAWVAVAAALLPLTTLFAPNTWVPPALAISAVASLTGVAARTVVRPCWLVTLAQAVVGGWLLAAAHAGATLWYGLPTWDTAGTFVTLLRSAVATILHYSAPAPATAGVSFSLGLLFLGGLLAVDAVAVTWAAPAAAGIPLLAAYLVPASNTGAGLSWLWFLGPALLWLALLARAGRLHILQWGHAWLQPSAPASQRARGDWRIGFARASRLTGAAAVAAALAFSSFVPHLPTSFIGGGLARGNPGDEGGGVRMTTTVDVARSLTDLSTSPVLSYRLSSPNRIPLRVAVLANYYNGLWTGAAENGTPAGPDRTLPDPVAPEVPRTLVEMTVSDSALRSPQLAAPSTTTRLDLDPALWSLDAAGVIRTTSRVSDYSLTFADLAPRNEDFAGVPATPGGTPGGPDPGTLALPGDLTVPLQDLADTIVPADRTPLEQARAFQAYLRSTDFSYSLDLAPVPTGEDPLLTFLRTRQGYCVQFATAFTMLARSRGMPARVAIGYLPGELRGQRYVVRAADAHAWPEVFFPDLGWIRFEPTPATRSGGTPAYTVRDAPAATASGSAQPSATATPVIPPRPEQLPGGAAGGPDPWWVVAWSAIAGLGWFGLALLAALVVLAVVPARAWAMRRSARRRARTEAARVEAAWQELVADLDDLGIPDLGPRSPRQAAASVAVQVVLDAPSRDALGRAVATLEQARYAAPGRLEDGAADRLHADRATVVRRVRDVRAWRTRLLSRLLPRSGRGPLRTSRDQSR